MMSDLVERLRDADPTTDPVELGLMIYKAADEIERLQDRQFAGDGEPYILKGKDMTQHWVDDGSTDRMRRMSKEYEEKEGRDFGSTAVVLENLADDFDLMAEHAVQLRVTVKRLESELAHQRRQRESALRYGCEMQELIETFSAGDDLTPHRERCPHHTAMLEVYRDRDNAVSF